MTHQPPDNDHLLDEIAAANSDVDPRTQQRAEAIKLLLEGHTGKEVAELMGVLLRTVKTWHKRFVAEGPDGLKDRPRSGRPPKATRRFRKTLENVLVSTPEDLGYDQPGWTVPLLCDHLARKTGITLSESRMRALLKRMGYEYRRVPNLLDQMMPPLPKTTAEILGWIALYFHLYTHFPIELRSVYTWMKVSKRGR